MRVLFSFLILKLKKKEKLMIEKIHQAKRVTLKTQSLLKWYFPFDWKSFIGGALFFAFFYITYIFVSLY